MRAILHLCRVIYGCTLVTYGSRQRERKSRTPQPCPRTAAAVRSSARCGSADGAGSRCVSPRQAYRYLQQARRLKQPVPISDTKVAFTVKLSQELIRRIRSFANTTGLSLSEIVSRALLAVLRQRRRRG